MVGGTGKKGGRREEEGRKERGKERKGKQELLYETKNENEKYLIAIEALQKYG